MTSGDSLWLGEPWAGFVLCGDVFGFSVSTGVEGRPTFGALLEPSILITRRTMADIRQFHPYPSER